MIRNTGLLMTAVLLFLGCPGDDDFGEDGTGDDDSADGDAAECEFDPDAWTITADCTSDGDNQSGTWTFALDTRCGAEAAWIEVYGVDWCWGGTDPVTGDPCTSECAGVGAMTNLDFGWSEEAGFWDTWELEVDFDLASDDPCLFPYACGEVFEVWACACDAATGNCFCAEMG